MRLLVLGGTVFLGRHVVEAALARGHAVSLFTRGRHGAELFPAAERLVGDRDGDLSALEGKRWDAVVDTSGYVPRVVGASVELLAGAVEHYTFVSSVSVYADTSAPGVDESAAVARVPDERTEDVGAHYGALKALCERSVARAMPGRCLTVRPGLIVGPHDPTGRFTYWVRRVARGGTVLAPAPPEQPVQLIDARDLAEWIVRMAEDRVTGVYNAVGPAETLDLDALLEECRTATGSDARFTWVDERFLLDHGVAPWSDLPLWLAVESNRDLRGFLAVDARRAMAAGLCLRPLGQTIRNTLAWTESRRAQASDGAEPDGTGAPAGLSPDRERELLAAWTRSGRTSPPT